MLCSSRAPAEKQKARNVKSHRPLAYSTTHDHAGQRSRKKDLYQHRRDTESLPIIPRTKQTCAAEPHCAVFRCPAGFSASASHRIWDSTNGRTTHRQPAGRFIQLGPPAKYFPFQFKYTTLLLHSKSACTDSPTRPHRPSTPTAQYGCCVVGSGH